MQGISPVTIAYRYGTFLKRDERLSPKASILRVYENNPLPITNSKPKEKIEKKDLELEECLSNLNRDLEQFEADLELFEEDSSDIESFLEDLEDSDNNKSIECLSKALKDLNNVQKDLEAIEKDLEKFAQLKETQLNSIIMPISTILDKLNQAKKIPKLAKSFERIKRMLTILMGILKLSSKTGFNFNAIIDKNTHFKKIKSALFKELHSVFNWKANY